LKSPEFQAYRTALLVTFVVAVGIGAVLLGASIVVDLVVSPHRAPAPLQSIDDCRRDVTSLLVRLAETHAAIELAPVKGDAKDLPARWDEFAAAWQRDWEAARDRCGFGQSPSGAYERLAHVHENLFTLRLKYAALLARFSHDVQPDVTEMRRALDRINAE